MDSESSAILGEAYQRLHRNGPEVGGDERGDHGLTSHGPMAVEVICRRGLEVDVHRWPDRYIRRLTDLPAPAEPITDATWRQALGGGRLPQALWAPSFTAAWAAAAALTAAYAPAAPPEHPGRHALGGTDPASDALAQAARHGDEHVLKFTDTAVEVYRRTGDASALTAAQHAAQLIDPPLRQCQDLPPGQRLRHAGPRASTKGKRNA